MAQTQALVTLTAGQWTELTDADATTITLQAVRGDVIFRAGGTSAPTPTHGYLLPFTFAEKRVALADLANDGSTRVWGRPAPGQSGAAVIVDHA